MRKLLLASAALAALAALPALAQTATPDTSPAATPPAAATDQAPPAQVAPAQPSTPAPSSTMAPSSTATPPKHHHHMARSDAGEPTTFAHEPGTGQSGPASARASNIDSGDSHSAIAPHLPSPRGGENAGYVNYLRDADRALRMHHTGEAQQALEMAETRLLDRSTPAGTANQPDQAAIVQQVSQARQALGHNDLHGAQSAIEMALHSAPQ